MYELLKDSLKKRKNFLMIIVVVQLLSVILSTLLPYMNGMFVDMLIKVTNIEKIIKYSIMIAGLGILSLCFSYIYNLKIMKIKNNISFEINSRGIFHLQKIPLEIEYEPTYMTQRLSSDSRIVVDFFFDKIVTAIINLFVMFFLIALLFYLSMPIFGVTGIFIIIYIFIYIFMKTSVYKGYKQDKIEMRGDRAEMSDFPLYLNTVAGGLDRRDQTIGGFSFVVKIYAVPVVEIIG